MIKLIATDVDGTLVKDSSREVPKELVEMIRKLIDKGIHFMIASGRQYASISKMFESVQRPMYYIAENGAHILENDRTIDVTKMKREDVAGIMKDLRRFYPKSHVVASAPEGSFLESGDERFIFMMQEQYRNEVHLVEDILQTDAQYVKLAMYRKGGAREIGEKILIPKWERKVKVCMAGEEWVDFMDASVDKGNALRIVQERLGILPEETMVFGDNFNDIGMLQAAAQSYAVANAPEQVKETAAHICPSYMEQGVYQVLKEVVYEKL